MKTLISEKLQTLIALCLEVSTTQKADAFLDFAGHVNAVLFRCHPTGTNYLEGSKPCLYPHTHIFLPSLARMDTQSVKRALEQMHEVEVFLTNLLKKQVEAA